MKRKLWTRVIAPLAVGAFSAALAAPAQAANCSSLPGPLYISGSSAVKNFLQKIGTALATASTTGPTIIYASPGSCQGVDEMFNGTKLTGTATYWDTSGNPNTCQLDAGGNTIDIGVSDVYFTSCDPSFGFPATLPTGIGEFFGPNQIMNFIAPAMSSQNIISAQAAYLVFGFPNGAPTATAAVSPWGTTSGTANIFDRGVNSGTQAMLSVAIGIPAPSKWKGMTPDQYAPANTYANSSSGMVSLFTALNTAAAAGSTIGIAASDAADAARTNVKILAFQGYGQDCAWLPDSSSTSFDKKNVRDGQYVPWGPIHFYAKVGAGGTPTNAQAANLVGYFDGSVAAPFANGYQDLITAEAKGSTVPDCAMHVKRTTEVGPVQLVRPRDAVRLLLGERGHRLHDVHGLHVGLQLHRRGRHEVPLRLLRGELT